MRQIVFCNYLISLIWCYNYFVSFRFLLVYQLTHTTHGTYCTFSYRYFMFTLVHNINVYGLFSFLYVYAQLNNCATGVCIFPRFSIFSTTQHWNVYFNIYFDVIDKKGVLLNYLLLHIIWPNHYRYTQKHSLLCLLSDIYFHFLIAI